MNYSELSKIKLHEFYWFYNQQPGYDIFINHLNQIDWMTEEEAEAQHEFYLLEENEKKIVEHYVGKAPMPLQQYSGEELELRRAFRRYLYKKCGFPLPEELELRASDPITDGQIEKITLYYDPAAFLRKRRQIMGAGIVTIIIFVLMAIFLFPNGQYARLAVDTGNLSADVLIDSIRVGSTNRIIENIKPGRHFISVKRFGYITNPIRKELNMIPDTTYQIKFRLIPENQSNTGVVLLKTNTDEARIFVDGEYWGNLLDYPWLNLPAGRHTVSMKKPFYKIIPESQEVTVAEADTVVAAFDFRVQKNDAYIKKIQPSTHIIEISAEVSGADIYVNGEPTGHKTDYVLMDVSPGMYKVSLRKEGYSFMPAVQTIKINAGDAVKSVYFKAKTETEAVRVSVVPTTAKILIDGKVVGTGSFNGRLPLGKHALGIQSPAGFTPVKTREFVLEAHNPYISNVTLVPFFSFKHMVDDAGNIAAENTRYSTGFYESFKGFSYSSSVGPELTYSKKLGKYAWKFGFAFPFRTPPGNDALQTEFTFNYNLNRVEKVQLFVRVAVLSEKYPRTMGGHVGWRVLFNNTKLHDYHSLDEIKDYDSWHTMVWDITKYLKYGKNTIEISTTDDNKQYFLIKEIIVTNKADGNNP